MKFNSKNTFKSLDSISSSGKDFKIFSLKKAEINGLEVLIKAREKFDLDKLPIIMVSSFDDVESISKCLQLGANEYLPKPLNSTILLAKVAATLERKMLREREKELLSELHHQAITDEMTGIPNRRFVFEELEKNFNEIKDKNKENFAVVIFDIDHFKNVNDTYGHAAGDEIIKKVCDLAKDNIENRIDGACARFLNYKKRYRSMPSCLFIHANSSLNIKSGENNFSPLSF